MANGTSTHLNDAFSCSFDPALFAEEAAKCAEKGHEELKNYLEESFGLALYLHNISMLKHILKKCTDNIYRDLANIYRDHLYEQEGVLNKHSFSTYVKFLENFINYSSSIKAKNRCTSIYLDILADLIWVSESLTNRHSLQRLYAKNIHNFIVATDKEHLIDILCHDFYSAAYWVPRVVCSAFQKNVFEMINTYKYVSCILCCTSLLMAGTT